MREVENSTRRTLGIKYFELKECIRIKAQEWRTKRINLDIKWSNKILRRWIEIKFWRKLSLKSEWLKENQIMYAE